MSNATDASTDPNTVFNRAGSTTPALDTATRAETAVNVPGNVVLSELEADAIEFIRSSFRHAAEALPLLTGELGDGLTALLGRARELAVKHGFAL